MNELFVMDVLQATKKLPKIAEVLNSINYSLWVVKICLQILLRTVFHLNHQVQGNEFDIVLDELVKCVVIKGV